MIGIRKRWRGKKLLRRSSFLSYIQMMQWGRRREGKKTSGDGGVGEEDEGHYGVSKSWFNRPYSSILILSYVCYVADRQEITSWFPSRSSITVHWSAHSRRVAHRMHPFAWQTNVSVSVKISDTAIANNGAEELSLTHKTHQNAPLTTHVECPSETWSKPDQDPIRQNFPLITTSFLTTLDASYTLADSLQIV